MAIAPLMAIAPSSAIFPRPANWRDKTHVWNRDHGRIAIRPYDGEIFDVI
jgi:hypothetical protein